MFLGTIAGALTSALVMKFYKPSQQQLVKNFYESEVATLVSPHHLRKEILKNFGDFIMIDLRSAEEYQREHIVGALNIPVYKDPDTSDYQDVSRILASFKEIVRKKPRKDVIIYCYSSACMSAKKTGFLLSQNNIFVKELGIGWNEWKYQWDSWNHEHEWVNSSSDDYIVKGKEPGIFSQKNTS